MRLVPLEVKQMQLSETHRQSVINSVGLGMPLRHVARLVKTTAGQIRAEMRADADFAAEVHAAEAGCMQRCLEALKDARQWQANTFLLESRWPGQFRRNRTPPEPRLGRVIHLTDERLANLDMVDLLLLDHLWAKMNGLPSPLDVPPSTGGSNGQSRTKFG